MVWETLEKGISLLNCLSKTPEKVTQMQLDEEVIALTPGTHTHAEANQLSKKDPIQPAQGFHSLLANMTTSCVLLRTMSGKRSGTYKGNWAVCRTMKTLEQKQSKFTSIYCKQITWGVLDDSHQCFSRILTNEDFGDFHKTGKINFSQSMLPTLCQDLYQLMDLDHRDFPDHCWSRH